MQRKAAALERSRQRQADKNYFASKKNEAEAAERERKTEEECRLKERQLTAEEISNTDKLLPERKGLLGFGEGATKEEDGNDEDPFALKNRSKIGGKYA